VASPNSPDAACCSPNVKHKESAYDGEVGDNDGLVAADGDGFVVQMTDALDGALGGKPDGVEVSRFRANSSAYRRWVIVADCREHLLARHAGRPLQGTQSLGSGAGPLSDRHK